MMKHLLGVAAVGLLLAACGDKPQIGAAPAKRADAKAWEGTGNEFVVQGWKAGDKSSWEAQLRERAQSQNEYVRAPSQR